MLALLQAMQQINAMQGDLGSWIVTEPRLHITLGVMLLSSVAAEGLVSMLRFRAIQRRY